MKHLDDRYLNDPAFHALVQMIEAQIEHGQFTPSEIREALMFAQLRNEMINPRPVTFSPDLMRHLEFMMKQPGTIKPGHDRE